MPTNTSATGGYLVPVEPVENDDVLVDLFGDVVAGVTALDRNHVRPRWQPKPPKRPADDVNWCAVGVILQLPDDNADIKQDNDENQTLRRFERVELIVSFYGPSARGYAGVFRDGLQIAQNRKALSDEGIGVVEVGQALNAAEPVGAEWVARIDVRALFNREIGRTYRVLTLASVTGEIETETLTVPYSVNQ